jgi:hypothetical protein
MLANLLDRNRILARLGAAAQATGTAIYAWTLLSNHAHLLLRSGPAGIPKIKIKRPDAPAASLEACLANASGARRRGVARAVAASPRDGSV